MSTSPPVVDISPPLMATSPTTPPSMGGSPPPHRTPPPHIESSSPRKAPSTPLIGPTLAPRNASDHPTTPDRCSNIDGLSSACHRKFDTSPPLSPSLVTALAAAAQSRSPSPSMGGSSALSMGGPPPGYPSPLLYRCPPPSPCGTPRLLLNDGHASIAVSGSGVHDKDFAARVEEVLRRRLTVEDGWRLAGESDCGLSSEGSCKSDREWRFQPQDPEEDEEEELTIYVARPGGMRNDVSSAMARNVSDAIMKSDSKMRDVAGSINVSLHTSDFDAALPIPDPTPPPSIRWGPGRKSYGVLGTRRTPSSQPTMRSVPSTLVDGAPSAGPVFVPSVRPNVVQGVRPNAIPIVRPDGTRLDAIARPDAVSGPRLHIPDQQAPIEEMPAMAMQSLQSADMPSPSFDSAYAPPGGIPHSPMSPTARSPSSDASYITSLTSDSASPTYPASPIASPPFTPTKQRSPAQYRSVTEPLAALGPRSPAAMGPWSPAAMGPWSPAPYVGARVSRARFWGTVSEPLQDKLPQAGWGRRATRSMDGPVSPEAEHVASEANHIASPPTTPGLSQDQEDEEDWSWALGGPGREVATAVGGGASPEMGSKMSVNMSRRTSMEEDWRAMQYMSKRLSTASDRRSSTEGTIPTEGNWRATQQFDWRASRTGRPVRRSWEVKDRRVSNGGVRLVSDSGVRLLGAPFVSDSGMTSDSAVHGRDTTNTSFRRVVSDGRRLDSPLGPMSLPRSPLSPSRGPSSSPRGPLSPTRAPLSPSYAPLSSPRGPLSSSYAPPSRTQRSFARASSTPEGILRHSDDGILRHSDDGILRHSDYDILRHSDDGILHQPGTPRHKDSRRTNSARHVHFGGEQRVVSGGGQRVDVDPLQNAVDMVRKAIDAVKKAVEPAVEVAADAGSETIADAGGGTMNNNVEKSALDDMVYREVMRAALGDGWEAATPTANPRKPTGEQRAPTVSPRTASDSSRKASDDQSSRPRSKGDEDKKGGEGDAKGSGEGNAKGSGKAPHPRSKRDRRGRPDAKGAKGTQARAPSTSPRAPSKSPRKKSKDPNLSRDGRALDEAIRAAMEDEPLPTWQVSKDRTSNVVALQMQALAMSQAASEGKSGHSRETKGRSDSSAKSHAATKVKPGPASAAMLQSASDAGGVGTGKATFWENARGTYVAQSAYSQRVC
ncbi:hypothetical protein K525DRAFT_199356 [Schizophyllum commune Loenen D]|nr:hypothetical protein K525DRAFT_199356 [Schizophyllum commune Loenen D]